MEDLLGAHSLIAIILILQLSTHINSSSPTKPLPTNTNTEYIKTSCNTTLYPNLCYRSLSSYASKIKANPELLAQTALNVSLIATKSTSKLMKRLSKTHGLSPEVAAAMVDCVEELDDSVYELQKSMGEMGHVKGSNFELVMSDIETWVSAALTDDDTCMDGFAGAATNGNVKIIVRKRIVRTAHLTSNALALVNSYASTKSNMP